MGRKITHILLSVFLCLPGFISAQVTDDFTDGDFSSSPAWAGNDTDFSVNAGLQLQLTSSGSGIGYLQTANTQSLNNCEWSFWIHLAFSPSSSNFSRVYLVSDQAALAGPLNGYYLKFGETGSADQVELFRQTGTTSVSICRGTTSIAAAFTIRVKVTRDNTGLWKLFIDPAGNTNYVQEASGTDNVFSGNGYFGVYCKYTSTNSSKFFFDDFFIYSLPDLTAPVLDSVALVSNHQVDAYFDEAVSSASAETPGNYSVNNGIGFASAAVQDTNDPKLIHLSFPNSFVNSQWYTLSVTGVQDLSGNNTVNANQTFLWFIPAANDIEISEIMADISPAPAGLPAYEYVELFNRSAQPVKLSGWKISDAASSITIPDLIIQPDSFYVLTSTTGAAAFGNTIQVMGVPSFPSLNDTGDDLVLRDNNGNVISVIYYRQDWYNDPIKENGGWSMEQIDPNSPCGGSMNWRASADISGGTPGRRNSVNGPNPDMTAPVISHIAYIDTNTIEVFFDGMMDSAALVNLASYTIDNGMGNPIAADPVELSYTSVRLDLGGNIAAGIIYILTVNTVKDCAGNSIGSNSIAQFALAEPPAAHDILINEIMFDPKENGVEWIEIYNRSQKALDLRDIYLCSQDAVGNLTGLYQVAPDGYLFFPQSFIVLSKDVDAIKAQYTTLNPEGFINMGSMPSLNNDSTYLILIDIAQSMIDKLQYHSDWHLPLLNDTKGISLERISYKNPSQDAGNWHSASESSGGATPAYKNSQYTDGEPVSAITVSPEVFTPDNDGNNDVLTISYAFDIPEMIGSITIFDPRGRLVRTLVRSELLGTSGSFFWDGMTDDRLKARMGIYIIYAEAFDTHGTVKRYKKACVVGGKL